MTKIKRVKNVQVMLEAGVSNRARVETAGFGTATLELSSHGKVVYASSALSFTATLREGIWEVSDIHQGAQDRDLLVSAGERAVISLTRSACQLVIIVTARLSGAVVEVEAAEQCDSRSSEASVVWEENK